MLSEERESSDSPGDEAGGADGSEADSPETADSQPPAELQRAFWVLVALLNGVLLALGVGFMLVVFRGETVLGVSLLVAGAGLLFYARERYRTVTATDWENASEPPEAKDA